VLDARRLSLDKFPEKRQFDVVWHGVWWSLNIAFLHEKLQVRHRLVFQLLQPLVKFHVVLISPCIVILASSGFAPVSFRHFECAINFIVERPIPIACLSI
jgi:hypothetical protein